MNSKARLVAIAVVSALCVYGRAGSMGRAATATPGPVTDGASPDGTNTATTSSTAAPEVSGPNPLAGAAELDARAAAIVAMRPTDLGDGFALMDLLAGIFPDVVGAFDRGRDSLGLYAFSRGELAERGVDPDALVLLSWGQIDADDWIQRRAVGKSATARVVWARHRLVVKVGAESATDETKLENAFAQALQKHGAAVIRLPRVRGAPRRPAWAKTITAAAKRASVRLFARGTGGDLFALRIRGGYALIDWAEPWAGHGKATDKLGPVVEKMLAPPKKPLSGDLSRAPRPLLASTESSISVLLMPPGLAALAPRAGCREDWSTGDGALLDEAVLLLRMHPFDWKLEIVWTLTATGRSAFELAAADDGLGDGRALVRNGHVAAALLVSSLDALGGGPGGKTVSRERLARALAGLNGEDIGCGSAGLLAAVARYWPQMARAVVDEALPALAVAPPGGRPRNVVALLGDPSPPKQSWIDAVTYFVSFPQTATTALEHLLGNKGGKGERQTFGDRKPLFFDFGSGARFEEAALESLAGGHVSLGMSPPGTGLGWYYRMRRRAALFGTQSNVGYLHVNVARLLGKLAESADAGTQAAVKLATSQFGLLGGNLTKVDGTLHLDLTLSPP